MQVLDDIGDASDKEKRKTYLRKYMRMDQEQSIQEFMEVLVIHYFKTCIQMYKL